MHLIFPLALVVLVAWGLWQGLSPRCIFRVRVRHSMAQATHGVVTPAFLRQVSEICNQHQVQSAVIRGIVRGQRIILTFSYNLPPACRQQLRNCWSIAGWPAPAIRRRGERSRL